MKIQKSIDTREIGKRIRQLRKAKSLTQDELGYVLRDLETGTPLSRGQVSNIETGKRNIDIHKLKTLADFFNVSLETLGIQTDEIETIDLLQRARIIFESDSVPLDEKQSLHEEIMKLYLEAKAQLKK